MPRSGQLLSRIEEASVVTRTKYPVTPYMRFCSICSPLFSQSHKFSSSLKTISFFDIPREIKDEIYSLLLVAPAPMHLDMRRKEMSLSDQIGLSHREFPPESRKSFKICINLLCTTKQAHLEVEYLLYSMNVFGFLYQGFTWDTHYLFEPYRNTERRVCSFPLYNLSSFRCWEFTQRFAHGRWWCFSAKMLSPSIRRQCLALRKVVLNLDMVNPLLGSYIVDDINEFPTVVKLGKFRILSSLLAVNHQLKRLCTRWRVLGGPYMHSRQIHILR
jgi:hypothetical protein